MDIFGRIDKVEAFVSSANTLETRLACRFPGDRSQSVDREESRYLEEASKVVVKTFLNIDKLFFIKSFSADGNPEATVISCHRLVSNKVLLFVRTAIL